MIEESYLLSSLAVASGSGVVEGAIFDGIFHTLLSLLGPLHHGLKDPEVVGLVGLLVEELL